MATYPEIDHYVRHQAGFSPKPCWIAHVKELNGLQPRIAPNRLSKTRREVPCPPDIRPIIEASMRRLRMLS